MEAARQRARTRSGAAGEFNSSGMKGVIGAVVVFLMTVGVIVAATSRDGETPAVELPRTGVFVNGHELEHNEFVPVAKNSIPRNMRVLMINDVHRPWTPEVSDAVDAVVAGLGSLGATVLGEVPSPSSDSSEVEAAAKARLVLDGEQIPVDSRDAAGRFKAWFGGSEGDFDAVVWVAPPIGDQVHPKVYVFAPGELGDSERTRAIVSSLENVAHQSVD
jgi:hypothetical protein